MKKILLIVLMSLSVVLLTSCSQNPFKALPETEILLSDTLSFNYNNGRSSHELFV